MTLDLLVAFLICGVGFILFFLKLLGVFFDRQLAADRYSLNKKTPLSGWLHGLGCFLFSASVAFHVFGLYALLRFSDYALIISWLMTFVLSMIPGLGLMFLGLFLLGRQTRRNQDSLSH